MIRDALSGPLHVFRLPSCACHTFALFSMEFVSFFRVSKSVFCCFSADSGSKSSFFALLMRLLMRWIILQVLPEFLSVLKVFCDVLHALSCISSCPSCFSRWSVMSPCFRQAFLILLCVCHASVHASVFFPCSVQCSRLFFRFRGMLPASINGISENFCRISANFCRDPSPFSSVLRSCIASVSSAAALDGFRDSQKVPHDRFKIRGAF